MLYLPRMLRENNFLTPYQLRFNKNITFLQTPHLKVQSNADDLYLFSVLQNDLEINRKDKSLFTLYVVPSSHVNVDLKVDKEVLEKLKNTKQWKS